MGVSCLFAWTAGNKICLNAGTHSGCLVIRWACGVVPGDARCLPWIALTPLESAAHGRQVGR